MQRDMQASCWSSLALVAGIFLETGFLGVRDGLPPKAQRPSHCTGPRDWTHSTTCGKGGVRHCDWQADYKGPQALCRPETSQLQRKPALQHLTQPYCKNSASLVSWSFGGFHIRCALQPTSLCCTLIMVQGDILAGCAKRAVWCSARNAQHQGRMGHERQI